MQRFSRWKVISILAMTFLAFLFIVPSFLAENTRKSIASYLPSWAPVKAIVLGLDLQGGAHMLLQVDSSDVAKKEVRSLRDDIRRMLREQKIRLAGGIGASGKTVQVRIPDKANREKALVRIRQMAQGAGVTAFGTAAPANFTIDEQDNGLLRMTITDAALNATIRRAIGQTIEVLRKRVDAFGTTEPNIQRQGADRVLVQVPGLGDTARLKKLIGEPAVLEFSMVADPGANPNDVRQLNEYAKDGKTIVQTYSVEKAILVEGKDLTDAQPGFDSRTNEPVVNFRFNIRGGKRFGEVTTLNVGKLFAIILDNKVISAPRILSPITGGSGQISGRFTVTEANDLSVLLRAGALPAKLTIVEERTVGPGLGQDSIDAGKLASYIAAALVLVYMLATYGMFGVFANIALFIHIVMVFAGLVLFNATLTLPGIAGIVLTIGMAVDANVLIYERIREEHRLGRSIISALDAGFQRAFSTIIDSQSTTMVVAIILYFMGSGPVRGFAVTLGLGIITTIVTAVTMTRMMIALWYGWKRPTTLPI